MITKKSIIILFVTAFLFIFSQAAFAQEAGKLGVGARISYLDISGDDDRGVNFEHDEAALYGIDLTYFFCKHFSLEASLNYARTDIDVQETGEAKFDFGETKQIPVLLTGRFHFPVNDKITPYIGAGVGYYFNDFDLSSTALSPAMLGPGSTADMDDSFGYHVNGGIEWFLNQNVALNCDLKYIWSSTDLELKVPGEAVEKFDVDLNAFVAGIGIKYYF